MTLYDDIGQFFLEVVEGKEGGLFLGRDECVAQGLVVRGDLREVCLRHAFGLVLEQHLEVGGVLLFLVAVVPPFHVGDAVADGFSLVGVSDHEVGEPVPA